MKRKKICKWPDCDRDISDAGNRTHYCKEHQEIKTKENKKKWSKRNRILTQEPKSAGHNKATWAMWKSYQNLTSTELQILYAKRKNDLKYETDANMIKEIKTQMCVIRDIYRKTKGEELEEEGYHKVYGEQTEKTVYYS